MIGADGQDDDKCFSEGYASPPGHGGLTYPKTDHRIQNTTTITQTTDTQKLEQREAESVSKCYQERMR